MIVVCLGGGLGSEMFKYALYRKFQEDGKVAACDIRQLERIKEDGRPTIDIFPNLRLCVADKSQIRTLGDVSRNIFSRVRRRIFHIHKKSQIAESEISEKNCLSYHPEILEIQSGYLLGWWQSECYFKDIRSSLLHEFSFPQNCGKRNENVVEKMENEVSVSLHIRRGDYLEGKNKESYGGCCTEQYYNKAIMYFKEKYKNPHFYIFSNDPIWVEEKYGNMNVTIVDWNQGKESYWDMYLMSKCKHNIIANSTFSWWGGWLNQNKNKEIIAPRFWFNPKCVIAEDIVPKEWKKLEG